MLLSKKNKLSFKNEIKKPIVSIFKTSIYRCISTHKSYVELIESNKILVRDFFSCIRALLFTMKVIVLTILFKGSESFKFIVYSMENVVVESWLMSAFSGVFLVLIALNSITFIIKESKLDSLKIKLLTIGTTILNFLVIGSFLNISRSFLYREASEIYLLNKIGMVSLIYKPHFNEFLEFLQKKEIFSSKFLIGELDYIETAYYECNGCFNTVVEKIEHYYSNTHDVDLKICNSDLTGSWTHYIDIPTIKNIILVGIAVVALYSAVSLGLHVVSVLKDDTQLTRLIAKNAIETTNLTNIVNEQSKMISTISYENKRSLIEIKAFIEVLTQANTTSVDKIQLLNLQVHRMSKTILKILKEGPN
jgi:hypothetical protein